MSNMLRFTTSDLKILIQIALHKKYGYAPPSRDIIIHTFRDDFTRVTFEIHSHFYEYINIDDVESVSLIGGDEL